MTVAPLTARVRTAVTHLEPELVAFRRDLHAHPELGRSEHRTSARITTRLERAGLAVSHYEPTAVVVDLGSGAPTRRVLLRADLDALPVREQTGLPYASSVDGVAHACGHDMHTTCLLGAGLALASIAEDLDALGVGVRLLFQHAEEIMPGGAEDVLTTDILDGVDELFALHCDPTLDVGTVGTRVGPITAASDRLEVHLSGKGGHTSRPHLTQDLVYALAAVVTGVPAAMSRRIDPRAGASLVWGLIDAGDAANVIPSSGHAIGTVRVLDAQVWRELGPLLEQLVTACASPFAVTARAELTRGVPPVVNDAGAVAALQAAIVDAGAQGAQSPQSLGGEDFAWLLTERPGALARLGTRTRGGPTYDLHQGNFAPDEAALPIGASVLALAALHALTGSVPRGAR